MKLGVEPRVLDTRRRAGELLGVRDDTGTDYLYPVWQFDPNGDPLPGIGRVVREARQAGLRDAEVADLLQRRDGMTGHGRLLDDLRAGREERVVDVIRRTARRS